MSRVVYIRNEYSNGFDKVDFPVAFVALLQHLNLEMICQVNDKNEYGDYISYQFEQIKEETE